MEFKVNFRSKLLYRPCTKALAILRRRNKLNLGRRLRSIIKLPALLHHTTITKSRKMGDNYKHHREVGDSRTPRERLLLFPVPSPSAAADPDVEDACRSFENYLVEMILEEGKLIDLMDVEELLFWWKKLKCPVFSDLVSRFYGELCKDLFTSAPTSTS